MTPYEYVEAMSARGIVLWREGEALCYRAAPGTVTPPLLASLMKAKPHIWSILSDGPEGASIELERDVPRRAMLYPCGDPRQELLDWVRVMIQHGELPIPAESIKLPSGRTTGCNIAEEWLAKYHSAAVLSQTLCQDDKWAFLVLRNDLKATALWFADAWRWQQLPVTNQGAFSFIDN